MINTPVQQQQDLPVSHNPPQEQQQLHPETAAVQHASEQGAQQHAAQPPQHPPEQTQKAPRWQSYSSVFTAAKAGMGGVDQAKVKQVVYEMSKVRGMVSSALHMPGWHGSVHHPQHARHSQCVTAAWTGK